MRVVSRSILGVLPSRIADALRAAKRWILNRRSAQAVFREIYMKNGWDGVQSISGPGSSMDATANIRAALPGLLDELGVKSILDVPCGDVFWIASCLPPELAYIGGDIVAEIIAENKRKRPHVGDFLVMNLVDDVLPRADMILVRDCFIHLPNRVVLDALANIRRSKIDWLLATTFPNQPSNMDIETGGFRPVNLNEAPFNLGEPQRLLFDEDGVHRNGKHLGLWRLK